MCVFVFATGGVTQANIEDRQKGNCTVPGINQYGFDEYVAMSEGMYSARYWTQQRRETYAKGANFLYRNDVAMEAKNPTPILTDKQTDEALRVIEEQTKARRPFFLNIWYDAPHSPWEAIEPHFSNYNNYFPSDLHRRYASMITNMDMNIGRILKKLADLNIEEDTLVFFTSDNGPENDVGSAGPFKGRKRLLTEGGIRVPALAYWKGKIPPGSKSNAFMLTTDIFPTFIEAAGGQMPSNLRIDGFSALPTLLSPSASRRSGTATKSGDERVVLWYTHSLNYPKYTAAWSHGIKIIWNDYEGRRGSSLPPSWRIFNMIDDPYEDSNLFQKFQAECDPLVKSLLLPSSSTVDWNGVRHNRVNPARLSLIRHLQLAMYLFRYEGDHNWLLYHANKPFMTSPQCIPRNLLIAEALPTFSSILRPNFCGDSLMRENATGCVCSFSDCGRRWNQSVQYNWAEELIYMGLSHFAPTKGNLNQYISNLLRWTRFADICPNAPMLPLLDALTRSSLSQVDSSFPVCNHTGGVDHYLNDGLSDLSIHNDSGYARGDFVGNNWQRECHQRVHYDRLSRTVYLTTTSCSFDIPLMIVNFHGMPRGAAICPESLERLMNPWPAENYFDDNLLLGVLNLVLLSTGDE